MSSSPFIVSADWLSERVGRSGVSIVDASWYLPGQRDGKEEYKKAHIPGAVFFDQDKICDTSSGLPHTLPSPQEFARHVGAMGIAADDTIVVYDGPGFFAAPRVWWMFRIMGADKVFILDGGFDNWQSDGRVVTSDIGKVVPRTFEVKFDAARVIGFEDMRQTVDSGDVQIVDARPHGRFTAQDTEPRAGMRSGHMPGARNVPASTLSQNGYFKSLEELRDIFDKARIDVNAPVITSCGSGVTAAVVTLALESLGNHQNRLYDGSWSEWGGRADTSVATGEPS